MNIIDFLDLLKGGVDDGHPTSAAEEEDHLLKVIDSEEDLPRTRKEQDHPISTHHKFRQCLVAREEQGKKQR